MNKILLSARDLKIGGIEKALINLINYLIANNYDVTLILEEKKGELLDEISDKVKIVCYTPSRFKIVNLFNRLGFLFKYYNKFDTKDQPLKYNYYTLFRMKDQYFILIFYNIFLSKTRSKGVFYEKRKII